MVAEVKKWLTNEYIVDKIGGFWHNFPDDSLSPGSIIELEHSQIRSHKRVGTSGKVKIFPKRPVNSIINTQLIYAVFTQGFKFTPTSQQILPHSHSLASDPYNGGGGGAFIKFLLFWHQPYTFNWSNQSNACTRIIYNKQQRSAEITVNTSQNRTHRRRKVYLTTHGNTKFVSVDATVLLPPDMYEQSSLNRRHKHAACQFIFLRPSRSSFSNYSIWPDLVSTIFFT